MEHPGTDNPGDHTLTAYEFAVGEVGVASSKLARALLARRRLLSNWRRPRCRDMTAVVWPRAHRRMPRMSAADTMRKLVEQAGLSQREAANEIGVTQRTFRDWCAGKREPPRAVLMALELLSIKRKNQLLAGKLKTQVRTDGPFAIYAVTDDTLGKPDLRGYMIEGPGSYSSWLLSAEQVGPELEELKAKLGR